MFTVSAYGVLVKGLSPHPTAVSCGCRLCLYFRCQDSAIHLVGVGVSVDVGVDVGVGV